VEVSSLPFVMFSKGRWLVMGTVEEGGVGVAGSKRSSGEGRWGGGTRHTHRHRFCIIGNFSLSLVSSPTQAPTLIQVKLSTATTTLQCTSKVRVVISMVSRDRGSSTSRHPYQEGKRLSRSKVQSKVKWMRSRSWLWRKRW
jgi:hypothetical protein